MSFGKVGPLADRLFPFGEFYSRLIVVQQVLGEKFIHPLRHVRLVTTETVTRAGQIQHIKSLVGCNQGIDQTECIGGVDIVVRFAMDQKQVAFQVGSQFRVGGYLDIEFDLLLRFFGFLLPATRFPFSPLVRFFGAVGIDGFFRLFLLLLFLFVLLVL